MCGRGLHWDQLGALTQKWSQHPEDLPLQAPWRDKVLSNSELLFRITFLSKTKGRDPHVHTPRTFKQTIAPLFTRSSAFGSAGVSLIFSPLDYH